MTIVERTHVLQTYLQALQNGAHTQEQAVAAAAAELCLPEEAVIDVVWAHSHEVSL